MPKHAEETTYVSFQPQGRWVWKEDSQTMEFHSSHPAEEAVKRKKSQTNVSFRELQLRADWLAAVCTRNHRGRQSLKKSLSPAHLESYRSSVKKEQQDHVTLEDVKEAAVGLLQENYLLPIPLCFLDVLKTKQLDEVLAALLLYLSCFFEHRSLENKPASSVITDTMSERQTMFESSVKKQISQKKLAVCYFSLMMDLQKEQHPHNKGQMSPNRTEWLLHASLYSFFCFVCWVTFGRRQLRDIQEELGRLFYSDTFNRAVRNRTDGSSVSVNGSDADPEEATCTSAFKQRSVKGKVVSRTSQRPASLSGVVNQRSPLMVSLLPSPKERSPHLFLSGRSRSRSPSPLKHVDIEALMEQLDQQLDLQLAAGSFGILGKPLDELNRSSLMPCRDHRNHGGEDEEGDEADTDDNNDPADPPGAQGNTGSFSGSSRRTSPDTEDTPPKQTPQTLQLV